ncbi:hypothetical protein Ocin01_08197 [Orchesella cincta]|uniref:F-box domain-containing protein n=1 Tax=Orchesella cincta TaxID=48709 RepID=A0A1D2MZV0_ORCCI|nr:hypothetical protein Ocin01_08197 [Orchesella cincta]
MTTKNMQAGTRLQDTNGEIGFPLHIAHILNPGKEIKFSEILCRLIHVCMIEAGFVPIIDSEPDFTVEVLCDMTREESVPQLIKRLQDIIVKKGSLHNVLYRAIVMKEFAPPLEPAETFVNRDDKETKGSPTEQSTDSIPLEKKPDSVDVTSSRSLTSKESGDGSLVSNPDSISQLVSSSRQKAYSENIAVSIIHEDSEIFVVANGPGTHRNSQISVYEFSNYQMLPSFAKAREYLKMIDFKATTFATEVKRNFCYQIMDDMDALSFDIRSLTWMPHEVIVKIARCCSSLNVIRLRNTCSNIRGALGPTNAQFWKYMIKKDFPHHNIDILNSDPAEDKYFRKYTEIYRMTFRPLRRGVGLHRPPYYYMQYY